jgi:AAA15 family ATPase/GTPase
MLIEFQVENFRSFRQRQTLSMVASSATEHPNNAFDPHLKGFDRLLRSAAVYGPNAAGKTNLLRGLQFVQERVLNSANASSRYRYDPFKFSDATRRAPSEFQVSFVQYGVRYEYGFRISPGRIDREWLIEYRHPRGRMLFDRRYNPRSDKSTWTFSNFLKGRRSTWSEATRPDALFLSTAIQLNSKQLGTVFEWFQKRLAVVVGPTTLNESLTLKLLEDPQFKERLLPFLREADLNITDVKVEREPLPAGGGILVGSAPAMIQLEGNAPSMVKVTMSHETDNPEESTPLDFSEESHGTQTLFKTAGAWLNVMSNGEVLLVDEIDTSLHPLLVRFLIQRFHSEKANPQNAQLIFTTHNTSLLDQASLMRRDQIWFVDKDRDGSSKLYPLTDFKPRNDEVLEKGYIRGRYGALPILPVSPK